MEFDKERSKQPNLIPVFWRCIRVPITSSLATSSDGPKHDDKRPLCPSYISSKPGPFQSAIRSDAVICIPFDDVIPFAYLLQLETQAVSIRSDTITRIFVTIPRRYKIFSDRPCPVLVFPGRRSRMGRTSLFVSSTIRPTAPPSGTSSSSPPSGTISTG